jgi:hypothetical protein
MALPTSTACGAARLPVAAMADRKTIEYCMLKLGMWFSVVGWLIGLDFVVFV